MYSKGQITIPKAVRTATGIDVGDPVVVEARDGEIIVRRPRGVLEFISPKPSGKALTWPEARRVARQEHLARRNPTDGA